MRLLEVLFTPAEFNALAGRDLSGTTCVVFDVLRATSTMLTALHNGATAVVPVATIAEAVARRRALPDALLAGERDGRRIGAALSGGVEFDLGNSPREFTAGRVHGRTILMTTTNGTRALRACAGARRILLGGFVNLASVAALLAQEGGDVLVVCSGTYEEASFEDTLGAGALCDRLLAGDSWRCADSASIARELFRRHRADLTGAMQLARNGRRLLAMPDLAEDVALCLAVDRVPLNAEMAADGAVRRLP